MFTVHLLYKKYKGHFAQNYYGFPDRKGITHRLIDIRLTHPADHSFDSHCDLRDPPVLNICPYIFNRVGG